jgi:hypothetical protein
VTRTDGGPDVDAKWIRIKIITSLAIRTDLKVIAQRSCLGLDVGVHGGHLMRESAEFANPRECLDEGL